MRTSIALFALFLLPALALTLRAEDDEPAPRPGEAPAEEAPGPSEEERAEVRRVVDELRQEAARIRGLEWKHDVPADLLSRPQMRANFIEELAKELTPEEKERDIRVLRRLGQLGPDEDPYEMMLEMFEQMVGGYYNPDTKRLYLIEGMSMDAQRPVILHELVHALEDQYVDLDSRIEPYELDPDRTFAEKCIVEGSAEHASGIYQRENPEAAKAYMAAQQDPEMGDRQRKVLKAVPAYLILPTMLQYQMGPAFVGRGVGGDYAAKMASLYEAPPVSQEQVMHPSRWFSEAQDWPQSIVWGGNLAEVAGEGWEDYHELTVGELDLSLQLDYFLGTTGGKVNLPGMVSGKSVVEQAKVAAKGWDAGRVLFLEKAGLPLGWIQVHAFDTPKDAEEAATAFHKLLKKLHGDTFTGGAWTTEGERHTATYVGRHGAGRLMREGTRLVLVDGLPEEVMTRVWPAAAETAFVKDARDTWTPGSSEATWATFDLADKERGLGLNRPNDTWSIGPSLEKRPGAFAHLERPVDGGTRLVVEIAAVDVPAMVGLDQIVGTVEQQLAKVHPGFDAQRRTDTRVAGHPGYRYRVGPKTDGGPHVAYYMGSAPGRFFVIRAEGTETALDAHQQELDGIAASITSATDD